MFFLRKDKVQGRCFLVWSKPWLCCQKVINDGNPIFSFTFIFSLEFGLFHFYKHTLFSLLRHHPSAVSCDDSDLLLEESCVMDISTEVKIIWIIMIWGGITEVLCFIWVLVKLGFPFLGGRKQRISWAEAQRSICSAGWQCHHQGVHCQLSWIRTKYLFSKGKQLPQLQPGLPAPARGLSHHRRQQRRDLSHRLHLRSEGASKGLTSVFTCFDLFLFSRWRKTSSTASSWASACSSRTPGAAWPTTSSSTSQTVSTFTVGPRRGCFPTRTPGWCRHIHICRDRDVWVGDVHDDDTLWSASTRLAVPGLSGSLSFDIQRVHSGKLEELEAAEIITFKYVLLWTFISFFRVKDSDAPHLSSFFSLFQRRHKTMLLMPQSCSTSSNLFPSSFIFFSFSSGDTEEEMAAAALSRRQATQVSLTEF